MQCIHTSNPGNKIIVLSWFLHLNTLRHMDIWNMSEAFFEIINIFKSLKNTEVEKIFIKTCYCVYMSGNTLLKAKKSHQSLKILTWTMHTLWSTTSQAAKSYSLAPKGSRGASRPRAARASSNYKLLKLRLGNTYLDTAGEQLEALTIELLLFYLITTMSLAF